MKLQFIVKQDIVSSLLTFAFICFSQGSVAMHLRCGGSFVPVLIGPPIFSSDVYN